MSKGKVNQGIQVEGGNVVATNIAIGKDAKIVISGDVRGQVSADLAELRALIAEHGSLDEEVSAAADAVAKLEKETSKPKADRSIVAAALETLERTGKAGGAIVSLGEKIAPYIARLAALLL